MDSTGEGHSGQGIKGASVYGKELEIWKPKSSESSVTLTGGEAVNGVRQRALQHAQLVVHDDSERLEDARRWVDGALAAGPPFEATRAAPAYEAQ